MPDATDAPPVLADLINQYGLAAGQMLGNTVLILGSKGEELARAAFAHGVAEGLELAAQSAEKYAEAIDQNIPEAPAVSSFIRQLRDQLRVAALSVEIPS